MRITHPGPVERIVATWYVVGDVVTASPNRVKLETLKVRLLGGDHRAAAIHLSALVAPGTDPRAAIARFARALGPLDRPVDKTIGPRWCAALRGCFTPRLPSRSRSATRRVRQEGSSTGRSRWSTYTLKK